MRHAAQMFGVANDTVALVEALYLEFLEALNKHLTEVPYLLGWRPCIGDFGLLAPMYAHLGRDPEPLRIMQERAIRVYRWVERMNRSGQDASEFFSAGSDLLSDDEVPATLINVLQVLAEDLVPETRAAAERINEWLAQNQPGAGDAAERFLDMCQFTVRGQVITAVAQPYRFYLLQRVQDAYRQLEAREMTEVDQMLANCGLSEMLTIKLDRQLGRADNLEVWL
jgi:hypothetical protein